MTKASVGKSGSTDSPAIQRGASIAPEAAGSGGRELWVRPSVALGTYALLALIAVLASAPGRYVIDNRFEWYWQPWNALRQSLTLWDSSRGLGGPAADFAPVFTGYSALIRTLGASPALTERMIHATLLFVAGFGVLTLARLFVPQRSLAPTLAGLAYMFGPYTAAFLVPSSLFLNYALAPWLVVCFVWGVRDRARWRSAAAFALLIFVAGLTNPPGLVWAALPLVPTALYLVLVDRSARFRDVLAWVGAAAALVLLVMAAGLFKNSFSTGYVAADLSQTESVAAVSLASSWAESWRGLGFWLAYFGDRGPSLPTLTAYFTSPALVLATFVLPGAALAVLWRSRHRARLLFAGISVFSLVVMVGVFPVRNPSPFGQLLQDGYSAFPSLFGLRNTYKAGAGLVMGTAVLAAVGAASVVALARRRSLQVAVIAAFLGLVGCTSLPFWNGNLYARVSDATQIPTYYGRAFGWLNHQPGNGGVLVLPGSGGVTYRWGAVGDDILDGVSRHPIAQDPVFSIGQTANVLEALNGRDANGTYEAGMLAPIARRLGIEYVLIRNDMDWQTIGTPRPSALQAVRSDPELELVATFGTRGQNTTSSTDASPEATGERTLRPVEIFRVRDPQAPLRVLAPGPDLLVAGDGEAWPLLARRGVLSHSGPVRYTATLTAQQLEQELSAGAPVVITDTNRRRQRLVRGSRAFSYYTLTADRGGRGVGDLFGRPDSQSVATFEDLRDIDETTSGLGVPLMNRPSAAFDGDPATAWLTGTYERNPAGSLRATFRKPTRVSDVKILVAGRFPSQRVVSSGLLRLSDGRQFPLIFSGGRFEALFPPGRLDWIEIQITGVMGSGPQSVGFSEVQIDGVQTVETIKVPDDVFRLARANTKTERLLERAPMSYQFERLRSATSAVEQTMQRSFRTVGYRSFALRGRLRLLPGTNAVKLPSDPAACVDGIVSMDGRSLPVRINSPRSDVLAGSPVLFEGCRPVTLEPGSHVLSSTVAVDEAVLDDGRAQERVPSEFARTVTATSAGGADVKTHHGRATLVSGRTLNQNWGASSGGTSLGSPVSLDTQTGWTNVDLRAGDARIRFLPESAYAVAEVLSLLGLFLCAMLLVWPRRRRQS